MYKIKCPSVDLFLKGVLFTMKLRVGIKYIYYKSTLKPKSKISTTNLIKSVDPINTILITQNVQSFSTKHSLFRRYDTRLTTTRGDFKYTTLDYKFFYHNSVHRKSFTNLVFPFWEYLP